jgi:tetratricopeptide (TPR) repeat protein
MDILRELGGDTGLLLWQAYRNVMLWSTADEERGKMFSPEAGRRRVDEVQEADIAAELREPLSVVARMLEEPGTIEGDTVAAAATAIARWAQAEGAGGTALAFTQAAALAAPHNAALSHEVGLLSRERNDPARAETWFRHAIMIGRQTGDWSSYALSYIALGNMLARRGNFPSANRMEIKALRAARRKGLPRIQGIALHDLFVIADEMGRDAQAEEYARQAMRAYGPDHHKLPALAHDVAYFWMSRGYFSRVLPVFQALLPHFAGQPEEIWVHAHVARAAGGVGNREVFRKAWVEVNRMARDPMYAAKLSGAWVEIAEGAASLGEWDRAEQAAEKGLAAARERGENKLAARAEGVLDASRTGRRVEERRSRVAAETADRADALAADMVRSLQTVPVGA